MQTIHFEHIFMRLQGNKGQSDPSTTDHEQVTALPRDSASLTCAWLLVAIGSKAAFCLEPLRSCSRFGNIRLSRAIVYATCHISPLRVTASLVVPHNVKDKDS